MTTGASISRLHLFVHPGDGIVAAFGSAVFACLPTSASQQRAASELLGAVERAASDDAMPGRVVAQSVAELLGRTAPTDVPPFAVLSPSDDDGLAVMLQGDIELEVHQAGGSNVISGREAITWVERVIRGSFDRIEVRRSDGQSALADGRSRLDRGIVPGSGLTIVPTAAAVAPAATMAQPVPAAPPGPPPGPPPAPPGPPPGLGPPPVVNPLAPAPSVPPPSAAAPPAPPAPAMPPPAPPAAMPPPAPPAPAMPPPAPPAPAMPPPAPPAPAIPPPAPPAPAMPPPAPAMPPPAPPAPAMPPPAPPAPVAPPPAPVAPPLATPPAPPVATGTPPPPMAAPPPGVPLAPPPSPPPAVTPPPPPPARAASPGVLVGDDGSRIELDDNYILGREPFEHPDVTGGTARPFLFLDTESEISRAHTRVSVSSGQVTITDLKSANGTYIAVPGASEWQGLVPHSPTPIAPGTRILIGQRTFVFHAS